MILIHSLIYGVEEEEEEERTVQNMATGSIFQDETRPGISWASLLLKSQISEKIKYVTSNQIMEHNMIGGSRGGGGGAGGTCGAGGGASSPSSCSSCPSRCTSWLKLFRRRIPLKRGGLTTCITRRHLLLFLILICYLTLSSLFILSGTDLILSYLVLS